ncbi:hypothetical protein DSY14_27075 [Nocardiopsis sp. MG754419]|nr:hypothetical protein [Nocardiopsis sp. MG754419]
MIGAVVLVSVTLVAGAGLYAYDRIGLGPAGDPCSPAEGYAEAFTPSTEPPVTGRTAPTLTYAPDGEALATGTEDGVGLWDTEAAAHVAHVPVEGARSSSPTAFAPNGCLLAVGTEEGVTLIDLADGERRTVGEGVPARAVRFAPDGSTLAVGVDSDPEDRHLHLYSVADGERTDALEGSGGIGAIAFSEDGALVAGGEIDAGVTLWETASGSVRSRIDTRDGADAGSFALTPDGKRVLVVRGDAVAVHDTGSGNVDRTLRPRITDSALLDVAYSAEHELVLASRGERDGGTDRLTAWDLRSGEEFVPSAPSTAGPDVHPFTVTDDGASLAGVRGEDGVVMDYEFRPDLGFMVRNRLSGHD